MKYLLIILHIFLLNVVFMMGYDLDVRPQHMAQLKSGEPSKNPIEYLRLYYSDVGDVELYWVNANLILGRHDFQYQNEITKKYNIIHYKNETSYNIPYRDISIEYPPVVLPLVIVPALFSHTLDGYSRIFAFEMTIFIMLSLFLGWKIVRMLEYDFSLERYLGTSLAGIFLFGYFFVTRFDIVPAFFTILALYYLLKDRAILSASSIALGCMVKIYPIIIMPLLAINYFKNRDYKKIIHSVASFTGILLAVMALLYMVAGKEALYFLTYHSERGIQVQSIYAAVYLLLYKLADIKLQLVNNFGSLNIDAAGSMLVAKISTFVQILLMFAVYLAFLIKKSTNEGVVKAVLLTLISFILACKVFSPQYLIWLFPLAIISKDKMQTWLFLILCFVLQIETKVAYPLLKNLIWPSIAIISAKNLLFLLFYVRIWNGYLRSKE